MRISLTNIGSIENGFSTPWMEQFLKPRPPASAWEMVPSSGWKIHFRSRLCSSMLYCFSEKIVIAFYCTFPQTLYCVSNKLLRLIKIWFHEKKIVHVQCKKPRNSLSPKNISSNQLFSNLFSKTVTSTKFLPKMWESRGAQAPPVFRSLSHKNAIKPENLRF